MRSAHTVLHYCTGSLQFERRKRECQESFTACSLTKVCTSIGPGTKGTGTKKELYEDEKPGPCVSGCTR
jgi:hypothetical protein